MAKNPIREKTRESREEVEREENLGERILKQHGHHERIMEFEGIPRVTCHKPRL